MILCILFRLILVFKMGNLLLVCYSGGLFHHTEDQEELVFQYTMQTINSDGNVLPKTLMARPVHVLPHDSLATSNTGGYRKHCGVA